MARIRIGISGWRYAPWRGVFYPEGLPQREELAYAAGVFPSVEINGSFYSLQSPSSYGAWRKAVPEDFVFAIKAPRFITHIKRLRNVHLPLANFFASGVLRLGPQTGPLLWQLPPSFHYREEVLEDFLTALPRTTAAALALAREHDHHLRWPAWLEIDRPRRLRHAIEVRHSSFETPDFIAQLRKHKVALVVADTAGRWPFLEDVTADFVYVRLHGDEELYTSGYTDAALKNWATKVRAWAEGSEARGVRRLASALPTRKSGRDVFVYFDNDVKVHAPYDALMLAYLLGIGPAPQRPKAVREGVREAPRTRWPAYGGKRKVVKPWERAAANHREFSRGFRCRAPAVPPP